MVQKIKSSNLDADILTGNTELAEAANNADTVLVHDTSAGTLKKIQVSNLTAQAGDGLAKTNSTLAVDIPNTTLLDEGAATTDELLIYDTSASALRSITQSNFLNFPTVSSVSPTNAVSGDGTGNYTFIITGVGFTGGSANLIGNDGTTVNFDSVTANSNTQITGVIAKSSLPGTNEPYDVKVTGAQGLSSTLANQINIDQQPVFSTAAGSLGTVLNTGRTGLSFTVAAADPESGGDVVYTLESGSLPAGLSFASTSSGAVISGDADAQSSDTTSNFTIRAKDVNSNTSDRAFSITINGPATTSFTSSGTFSVPTGVTTVDVLVVAGGGSGGGGYPQGCGQNGGSGGAGAGGLIYRPAFPVTPGGTISVTVGDGGPAKSGTNKGDGGQNSTFGTLTAIGGGGGGTTSCSQGQYDGGGGGSGGGGADTGFGSGNSTGGTATQPTQSGDSGNYGFGNNGGGVQGGGGNFGGAGGGGAGAVGTNNPGDASGHPGGAGKAYTIADGTTSVYYAGGGGGAGGAGGSPGGTGGQGGGGTGGVFSPTVPGTDGAANRGGGGGGGAEAASSGAGGKGIVLVRF